MTTDKLGIYIHIPFCASKCHYCDFCSQPLRDGEKMKKYTDALINEIRTFCSSQGRYCADTVYFGGGTPSLLPSECFEKILLCLKDCFCLSHDTEISAEANPKTADLKKLSQMRSLGINRLSIGMQSVHDAELKELGRIHRFSDFESFYADARRAGFDNISVDLMYGIPSQSMESFEASLHTLAKLSPEHISSYCLKIEEGTRFFDKRESLVLPNEDTVCDMYEKMSEILAHYGYEKYEISNFSRKGKHSRHNVKYWKYTDYIGFGSGAHSFFRGERFCNSRDIDKYIETSGMGTKTEIYTIKPYEAANEYVMLGMRLCSGVDIELFEKKFGLDWGENFGKNFAKFAPEYVKISDKSCAFTDKGMLLSNYILSEVLDF